MGRALVRPFFFYAKKIKDISLATWASAFSVEQGLSS
jgi:hypothetical protein